MTGAREEAPVVERSESKLELIARELKRLREEHDEAMTRFRDWALQLDRELEEVWDEFGLRRGRRRREGSHRTNRKD